MSTSRSLARLAVTLLIVLGAAGATTRAQTAARHFVWKVESGSHVLYLAGSVHALSADSYPLPPAFESAFKAAGALVEEIDLHEATSPSTLPLLMTKGVYRDGRTFDQAVSRETATLVTQRLQSVPGLPELLKPMKPWMVMLMLTSLQLQSAGLDATLGLDQYFFDKAAAAGTPLIALETAESQIDRFDAMPEPVQEQMLRSTLADLDADAAELKRIVAAWSRGDAIAVERGLLDGFKGFPGAYDSLIVQRNRNWMPQLDACLARDKPCFVVVGAAHLVGPDGLVALLQKKGYRVTQQ